ncbi:hypothetical protein ACFLSW_00190 [Candidatus Bipolaricaulota bacterium]
MGKEVMIFLPGDWNGALYSKLPLAVRTAGTRACTSSLENPIKRLILSITYLLVTHRRSFGLFRNSEQLVFFRVASSLENHISRLILDGLSINTPNQCGGLGVDALISSRGQNLRRE